MQLLTRLLTRAPDVGSRPCGIANGFVAWLWRADRRELSGAKQTGQGLAVAAVGLHAIAGSLNILAVAGTPPIAELQAVGVRRISLSSGPARLALATFRALCDDLKTRGTFDPLAGANPCDDVNRLMFEAHKQDNRC